MAEGHEMRFAQGWDKARIQKVLRRQRPDQLADFIKARHEERFFRPLRIIKAAQKNVQGYGFAVMAICCLLIETIQSYRDGLPTTDKKEFNDLLKRKNIPRPYRLNEKWRKSGGRTFQRFFRDHRGLFGNLPGGRFYKSVRCGLLHQGQTKKQWKIERRDSKVWEPTVKVIYRNNFSEALECCFEQYLNDLRTSKWTDRLCRNAARKVWWLLRLS